MKVWVVTYTDDTLDGTYCGVFGSSQDARAYCEADAPQWRSRGRPWRWTENENGLFYSDDPPDDSDEFRDFDESESRYYHVFEAEVKG